MTFAGKLNGNETARLFDFLGFLARCAVGILGLGTLTGGALLMHLNLSVAELLYFLVIVLVALHWGFRHSAVLAAVAVILLCYFFIPPKYSLHIADAQSYVALAVFEFSALLVSRLYAQEQRSARAAEAQQCRLKKLYELSRGALQLDLHRAPGPQLLQLVKAVFEVDSVAIFDLNLETIDAFGPFPFDAQEMARNTCYFEINRDYGDLNFSRRVLRQGTTPVGALLIGGEMSPLTTDAIASLVSIALDRYHSLASEAEAGTAHRDEWSRTTVLDCTARGFKTSVTATATAALSRAQ